MRNTTPAPAQQNALPPGAAPCPADFASVSVVIPAYNEEAGLGHTLEALCSCEQLGEVEIIVVDDGSTDSTAAVAAAYPRVRLLQHLYNRGYGSAISTGLRASHGEYIVWFDADGQHRVEDLITVAEHLTAQRLEYCIGVRGEDSFQETNRLFGKWLLRQAVFFAAGRPVPDFNSGLRGFRRDILFQYLHLLPKRFGASTLTTLLMVEGSHYGETVPIVVKRRLGKSTVRQVRDGLRTLNIILHIVLLFKPLKFFGMIGGLFILVGGIYGLYKAFMIGQGIPVLASLLVILGVQAFFFGLLGDQISALRRERFTNTRVPPES